MSNPTAGTINDKRVSLLRDIIENLKTDKKVWEPVVKAAEKYTSTLRLMMQSAMGLVEALNLVAEKASMPNTATTDLGVGIHQIAEFLRAIEVRRGAVAKSLIDDLVSPLTNNIQQNKENATKFEKEYLKEHKRIVSDIKKAESESGKAGKKGPEALKQAIARVNDTVKEMEQLRQNKLREAIVEERKRYCWFIMHFATVLGHDQELHDHFSKNLPNKLSEWTQLAVSPDNLPPAVESLVTVQQRTFVPIQPGSDASAGYANFYEAEEYEVPTATLGRRNSTSQSDYIQNYSPSSVPPPPPPQSGQDGILRPGDRCRALYDYQGDSDKLSFRENDVIAVQDVDASGWCLGSLNGVSGWFPSNYVEKIRMAAGPPAGVPPPPRMPQQPQMQLQQQLQQQQQQQPRQSFGNAGGQNEVPFKTSGGQLSSGTSSNQRATSTPPSTSSSTYAMVPLAPAASAAAGAPPPPNKAGKYGTMNRASSAAMSNDAGPAAPPPPPPPAFAAAPSGGKGAPAPPPPPPAPSAGGAGAASGRNALLGSIQKGTGLRKVQTNDRSAPKF